MRTTLENPVSYRLPVGEIEIPLNQYIGKKIKLEFTGQIFDIHDGKPIKKSFGQGFSYKNFMKLACCDVCILKPEKCHYDKGTCREPEWGEENCMVPHIIYLANSSGPKIGITRQSQVPTRWIDQGASYALPILRVHDRKTSGLLEHEIAKIMSDKTSWQKMLKGVPESVDLEFLRDEIYEEFGDLIDELDAEDVEEETIEIYYPVNEYPEKVKSKTFDKEPIVEGTLVGIKGQYLILDTGVINIRRHQGYEVKVEVEEL
jgi:hypothetical protein